MVLGLPWFQRHNPIIDWNSGIVEFNSQYCFNACLRGGVGQGLYATTQPADEQLGRAKEEPVLTTAEMVPEHYHKYLHVFDKKKAEVLPPHRSQDCKIELEPDAKLYNAPVYPMSANELEALDAILKENVSKGFLRVSESKMASPIFFVKKKDGSLRPVVDYRRLNKVTIKDRYPLPLTQQLVDRLQGAKFFTKLDLRSGYNLIRIREGDEWKTAFKCRYSQYEYTVMPFGLCNAPAVFQRFMNETFDDMIDKGVIIYLDDILIYADTLEELRLRTDTVLERLHKTQLYAKPEKCEWEVTRVEYLGMLVSDVGTEMDYKKTDKIKDWPPPKSIKEIQEFLGFANFYRRFISQFSKICRPIHDLLKKGIKFVWTEKQQKAFEALKIEFQQAPLLEYPDPEKQFFVEADASEYATGGVLSKLEKMANYILWRSTPKV
jgi:hypothetical protein